MGVLKFDGTDDQLKWTTLASALSNVSDGAWTVAVLFKHENIAVFNGLSYLHNSGTPVAGVSYSPSVQSWAVDIGSGVIINTDANNTASPYMLVVSKGSGTVVPRAAWKLGSGGGWTHENFNGSIANQSAATDIQIGTWDDTDFADAWIGLIAWWEGAMSDAHKELLDNNWATSDWWHSPHGNPAFLAELNVAAGSVVDLAGNASAASHTGTSLDAGETLDSWDFNGVGTALYLHSDTSTVSGTLPTAEQSAVKAPDTYHIGLDEHSAGTDDSANHQSMDGTQGASENNIDRVVLYDHEYTHMIGQFVSPPLEAQSIGAGTWLFFVDAFGGSDIGYFGQIYFTLYLWRPSTGSLITMIWDDDGTFAGFINESSRTELLSIAASGASATATAGDVLILEMWIFDQSTGVGPSTTDVWYDTGTDGRLIAPQTLTFGEGEPPVEFQTFYLTRRRTMNRR